jgi:hypothetical protein
VVFVFVCDAVIITIILFVTTITSIGVECQTWRTFKLHDSGDRFGEDLQKKELEDIGISTGTDTQFRLAFREAYLQGFT